VAAALRATAHGHLQGRATGDQTMLSATFIVDRNGSIQFAHYAAFAGDQPRLDDILAAARASQPQYSLASPAMRTTRG
jgi:hypothetical protein